MSKLSLQIRSLISIYNHHSILRLVNYCKDDILTSIISRSASIAASQASENIATRSSSNIFSIDFSIENNLLVFPACANCSYGELLKSALLFDFGSFTVKNSVHQMGDSRYEKFVITAKEYKALCPDGQGKHVSVSANSEINVDILRPSNLQDAEFQSSIQLSFTGLELKLSKSQVVGIAWIAQRNILNMKRNAGSVFQEESDVELQLTLGNSSFRLVKDKESSISMLASVLSSGGVLKRSVSEFFLCLF
jgi:hypothetical protein